MARFFREDFDRDRTFVVTRAFVFNAQGYVPGQPIDKAAFTVRRLRQLYDMRNIGYPLEMKVVEEVHVQLPEISEPVKPKVARFRSSTGIERRRLIA